MTVTGGLLLTVNPICTKQLFSSTTHRVRILTPVKGMLWVTSNNRTHTRLLYSTRLLSCLLLQPKEAGDECDDMCVCVGGGGGSLICWPSHLHHTLPHKDDSP